MENPSNSIHLSKSPDLIIEVTRGENKENIHVSKRALGDVSSVFLRMIDPENGFKQLPVGSFSEKEIPILALDDDDPDAVILLLRILHNIRKPPIPRKLTAEKLMQLATVCDKYDCAEAVDPWPDFWLADVLSTDRSRKYLEYGNEAWLKVGHVFKGAGVVDKVVEVLSIELIQQISSWESLSATSFERGHGSVVLTENIPDPILKYIWEQRGIVLRKLVNLMEEFYRDMKLSSVADSRSGKARDDGPLCDDFLCVQISRGSLIESLRDHVLPLCAPINIDSLRNISITDLCTRIWTLQCTTIIPWASDSPGWINIMDGENRSRRMGASLTMPIRYAAFWTKSNENPPDPFSVTLRPQCGISLRLQRLQDEFKDMFDGITGYSTYLKVEGLGLDLDGLDIEDRG